jgi:hypothetical protein
MVKYVYQSPEPSGGASGPASDIAIHAMEILRVRRLLTGMYQRHCRKGEETEQEALERFGTSSLSTAIPPSGSWDSLSLLTFSPRYLLALPFF